MSTVVLVLLIVIPGGVALLVHNEFKIKQLLNPPRPLTESIVQKWEHVELTGSLLSHQVRETIEFFENGTVVITYQGGPSGDTKYRYWGSNFTGDYNFLDDSRIRFNFNNGNATVCEVKEEEHYLTLIRTDSEGIFRYRRTLGEAYPRHNEAWQPYNYDCQALLSAATSYLRDANMAFDADAPTREQKLATLSLGERRLCRAEVCLAEYRRLCSAREPSYLETREKFQALEAEMQKAEFVCSSDS